METFGYFGKVPAARDFVFHGLSPKFIDAWAGHVSGWLAAGRAAGGAGWARQFLTSPVWRFALSAEDGGAGGWAGLMASSLDGARREFLFMVTIRASVTGVLPTLPLNATMDLIEPQMLAFMEGQLSADAFLAAFTAIDDPLPLSDSDGLPMPLREGDDAVCFSGIRPDWASTSCDAVYVRHGTRSQGAAMRICRWWHEGGGGRPAELCITRGLPAGDCAVPFFLSDWASHGWVVRAADDNSLVA